MKLSENNSTIVASNSSTSMEEISNQNVVFVTAQSCSAEDLADRDANIGKYLKKQRARKKLTVRQLATKAKISYAELSRIENGRKPPTASTLRKLSPYLAVPIDTLLEYAGFCFKSESNSPVYLDLEGHEFSLTKTALKTYERNVEFFFQLDNWIDNCSNEDIALASQFLSILERRRAFEEESNEQKDKNLFLKFFSGLQSLIQAYSAV